VYIVIILHIIIILCSSIVTMYTFRVTDELPVVSTYQNISTVLLSRISHTYTSSHSNEKSRSIALVACRYGYIDLLRYCVETLRIQSSSYWDREATINGHLNVLEYLVDNDRNVASRAYAVCHVAAAHGHLDIIEWAHLRGYPFDPTLSTMNESTVRVSLVNASYGSGLREYAWNAVINGNIDALHFAIQHGYKYSLREFLRTFEHFRHFLSDKIIQEFIPRAVELLSASK